MNTGTVMWFNNQKGFGFIQPDNGNKNTFVHITAVERAGMYELKRGRRSLSTLSLTAGPASLPQKICKPPNGNASPDAAHQSLLAIPFLNIKVRAMQFRPLHDRVVVRRIEEDKKTAGGIIIPDTVKEKPMQGEVIAVGPRGARRERQARAS